MNVSVHDLDDSDDEVEKEAVSALPLDALPPGFRQQIASLNLNHLNSDKSPKPDLQARNASPVG